MLGVGLGLGVGVGVGCLGWVRLLRGERVCPRAEELRQDGEGGGEVRVLALQVALRVGQRVQLREVHVLREAWLGLGARG